MSGENKRNNPAGIRIREEGGGKGASGTGAEIPLQAVERGMVKLIFKLQLVKDQSRQIFPDKLMLMPTLEQIYPEAPQAMGMTHVRADRSDRELLL